MAVSYHHLESKEREANFESQVRSIFHELATERQLSIPGAVYSVSRRNSRSEDIAKYIQIVQIGPESGFLGLGKKRRELAAVRIVDHQSGDDEKKYPIQVTCYHPGVEMILTEKLERLSHEVGASGVHFWRRGYFSANR